MTDHDCLSMMELVDLRSGGEDREALNHLAHCSRCQALFVALPEQLDPPDLEAEPVRMPFVRPESSRPTVVHTGQLWRAASALDRDWAWPVVIIGRSPNATDQFLVAALVAETELATERDPLLPTEPLGYATFADTQNLGTLLERQLVEPLGALGRADAKAVAAVAFSTLTGQPRPEGIRVGFDVSGPDDPRLLAAAERGESLRRLWAAVDGSVTDDEGADVAAEESRPDAVDPTGEVSRPDVVGFELGLYDPEFVGLGVGQLIAWRIDAQDAEWDQATLIEAIRIEPSRLAAFRRDQLDITDQADIVDLARTFGALGLPFEETKSAVVVSLHRSPGGRREATGSTTPMAARSEPTLSAEEVSRRLYGDQSAINDSPRARTLAIRSYLHELAAAFDDLG